MEENKAHPIGFNGPPPHYGADVPLQQPPSIGVTVVQQPGAGIVFVGGNMGSKPTTMVCRSCQAEIVTRVDSKSTTKTHLFALLICLICFPCMCIPYCVDSCKRAEHYCPNCNAYIGSNNN